MNTVKAWLVALAIVLVAAIGLGGCNSAAPAWNEACARADRLHGLTLSHKEAVEIRHTDAARVRDANEQFRAYWNAIKIDPADATAAQAAECRALTLKALWVQDPDLNVRIIAYADITGPDWNAEDEAAVRNIAARKGADIVIAACTYLGTQEGVGVAPMPSFATATATNNYGGAATATGYGWTAVPIRQNFPVYEKAAVFLRHCSAEDVAAIEAARGRRP